MTLLFAGRFFALVLLLCTLGLSAQTSVTPSQLKSSQAPAAASSYIFLAYTPGGAFRPVKMGAGLVLDVDPGSGQATLRSVAPPPNISVRTEVRDIMPDAQGNIAAPGADTLIYRNGILQKEGEDYTISGTSLVPNPAAGWAFASTTEVTKDIILAVRVVVVLQP